ncbi:hypothetical protein RRG08_051560 [Elysia crispata]|uniref:Transcriptional adapter 3-like n=1 Tax=Elysia crispata TaxID=231223 RepID=A0AAE0Y185_9GAST|nr:hypothetical protein RRG08_051560 [Elysia crispata]
MKGKGKATQQDHQEKDRDIKDCPLQFPDLCAVDHSKECPKYSQVLSRDDLGQVSIEELDQVQADIEILLASVGRRLKLLGSENHVLASWPDKKDVKKSAGKGHETSRECSTPTKRKGTPVDEREKEGKSSKKFKDSNGRSSQPSTPTPGPRSKGKNSQSKGQPEEPTVPADATSAHTPITDHQPKVYNRKDAVNRFWASVEPYCTPISSEDLKVIEEMLASYEQETDLYRIPPLGVHYTQRWAQEDLAEEQSDGCRINDKKKPVQANGINGSATEADNLLKKAEIKKNDYYMDDSPFGPLTQRLVSALIEDNLMAPMDDAMQDMAECADEAPAISPKMLAKQLNIGNPATLERRLRKELEEQGIIEKEEDEEEDDPEDEVLAELRKKQQELRAVCQQNVHILRSLHRQGREDVARQGLKKKLQACDAEIMEAYRKIQLARHKKKSPTKKDKEVIAKALKERETIVKALDL